MNEFSILDSLQGLQLFSSKLGREVWTHACTHNLHSVKFVCLQNLIATLAPTHLGFRFQASEELRFFLPKVRKTFLVWHGSSLCCSSYRNRQGCSGRKIERSCQLCPAPDEEKQTPHPVYATHHLPLGTPRSYRDRWTCSNPFALFQVRSE